MVSPTRLPGEKNKTLNSGNTLYQNNSENNHSQKGVAFLVHRRIDDLVNYLVIKLKDKYSLPMIHGYAPTSTAETKLVEILYEDITHTRNLESTYCRIPSFRNLPKQNGDSVVLTDP